MHERPADLLGSAFEAVFAPWRSGGALVCILYSGGVDSGVIAWELRDRPETRLFTVGRSGSADLSTAEATAPLIGLPWSGHTVQLSDLRAVEAEVSRETDPLSPTARSVLLALAIAIRFAPPGELLCGQGVDELFLGYAHFAGLDPSGAESRSWEDLERLLADDWPRTQRIAHLLGRRIHAPFLDPRLVAAALAGTGRPTVAATGSKGVLAGVRTPSGRTRKRSRGAPSVRCSTEAGSTAGSAAGRCRRSSGPGSRPRREAPAAGKACP